MKMPVFSDVLFQDKINTGPEMLSTGENMFVDRNFNNTIKKLKGLLLNPISL